MKIRYAMRDKNTRAVHFKWYTLKQLENGGLSVRFNVDDYDILARDLFTGLKDRNGKEIYEGDICYAWINKSFEIKHNGENYTAYKKVLEKIPRVVEFFNGSFRLNNPNDKSKNYYGVIDYGVSTMAYDLEITGNIHE